MKIVKGYYRDTSQLTYDLLYDRYNTHIDFSTDPSRLASKETYNKNINLYFWYEIR